MLPLNIETISFKPCNLVNHLILKVFPSPTVPPSVTILNNTDARTETFNHNKETKLRDRFKTKYK